MPAVHRHTKCEMSNAAKLASELNIQVRLEPDGTIIFCRDTPIGRREAPAIQDEAHSLLDEWKANRA